jgi:hypothetical protein
VYFPSDRVVKKKQENSIIKFIDFPQEGVEPTTQALHLKGFDELKFWLRVDIKDRLVCLKQNREARRSISGTPQNKRSPKAPEIDERQKIIYQAYERFKSSGDYNEPITLEQQIVYQMKKFAETTEKLYTQHQQELEDLKEQLAMKENENVALTEKLKQTKMKLKAAREEIDELKKNAAGNSDSYGRERTKQNFEKDNGDAKGLK